MMLKRIDRYLLREMIFPFVLAVFGFILYIALSFTVQMFYYFANQSIPLHKILEMLVYRLPELAVYSLAIAMLFSIFLSIGRLAHDHETIAFQAAGFSLRRLTVPLLVVGLLVSVAAFSINEFWTPWATHRYFTVLRELQILGPVPQIRQNIFFTGPDHRIFYIDSYDFDEKTKKRVMKNIFILDRSGKPVLGEKNSPFPKTVTAREGEWEETHWILRDGHVQQFDENGRIEYLGDFQTLTINIELEFDESFLQQLTPSEMTMRDIWARIQMLQKSGLSAAGLIVEFHSRVAIPFAAFIFALFAAPLSLIFGQAGAPRGRAVGIILGILLVALSQGTLILGQTLGRSETIPPALGPWLPDIIFGLIGVLLMFWMDQLSRTDLWQRAKRLVFRSAVVLLFFSLALPVRAQEMTGLDVTADSLNVTRDWTKLSAEGHVKISYEKGSIQAEKVSATRLSKELFQIEATGPIAFKGEGLSAEAKGVTAELKLTENRWSLQAARLSDAVLTHESGTLHAKEISLAQQSPTWQVIASGAVVFTEKDRTTRAEKLTLKLRPDSANKIIADSALLEKFSGEAKFENSVGEEHTIRYEGQSAQALFKDNSMQQLDISKGDFTTCTCEAPIPQAAYALQAEKFLLYTDQFLIATNITVKVYGFPIFWSPLYFAPLKEEQKSPLLPEIGQSPTRGWFAKWRIPFFLDPNNRGFLSIDYFSKRPEVGTGIDFNYLIPANRGHISFYRLIGYGESFSIDWNHHLDLPLSTAFDVNASSRTGQLQKDTKKLFGQATLSGTLLGWRWSLSGSRDQYLVQPEDEEITYSVLEKLPEFSIARSSQKLFNLPFTYSFSLSAGRYREKKLDKDTFDENSRFDTAIGLRLSDMVLGALTIRAGSNYRLSFYRDNSTMEAWDVSPGLSFRLSNNFMLGLDYTFRQVRGQSPFNFDKLSVLNKVFTRVNGKWGDLVGALTGSYDFSTKMYDPSKLTLSYQTQSLSAFSEIQYDLNKLRPQLITARAGFTQTQSWSLSAQTGYHFDLQAFDDLILKFSMEKFRLSASVDLNKLQLKRVNGETDFSLGERWDLSLDGEYDFQSHQLSAWQVGVIYKFCHNCWQLGLYSDGGQIWLQARVTAFPMAEIEYSPTDQRLSFGGK
ncbi:LptF/LptG family permease [Candidatus Acetothermia bacterium]|nr:LptF/LptG family permease [Candidatus Acetothermia bacterium]